jgi:hypothetical protein
MVFGAYFFLSEDKVNRFKMLSNIAEVITTMEGVSGLIFLIISVIPAYINAKQLEAKIIRNCYYDVDNDANFTLHNQNLPAKPMKFNICDKVSTLKRKVIKVVCKCYKS